MARFNLAMPARQVPVTRFGGLFTLADPRDLPEGASWLCQDTDFIISGIGLRPGLTDTGINGAGAGQPQWLAEMLLGANWALMSQDLLGGLWSASLSSGGPLGQIYSGILNGARALGFAANLREYICLSNANNVNSYPLLPAPGTLQGTDQPRQFDGSFLDRISQMGPGVGPAVATVESAITPAAPTLSYSGGGGLPARAAWVVVAYTTAAGAVVPSAEATILLGAGTLLVVDSPASVAGVTGWNVYVSEQESGAETQQNATPIAIGTNWTEPDAGATTTGVAAPVAQVTAGPRFAILFYLTRSGYLTPASPPVAFTTTADTIGLTFSSLSTGPANILQRIVAWTPANAAIGGPYFYVPGNVNDENGNPIQASIVPDNSTTSFTINISDQVLQEGVAVATPGNNLFLVRELGEPVKGVQYAGRNFFMGARNKIDQFLNTTFDGGGSAANPIGGWTPQVPDAVTHKLLASPIFGFSYYFKNGTAYTVNPNPQAQNLAALDMIGQSAYQTAFGTPILIQGRRYGVRATVWSPSGNSTGEVWIGFASALANSFDVFKIPATLLTRQPQEFIGPLNVPAVQPPVTLTPPVSVPSGQAVAWALPQQPLRGEGARATSEIFENGVGLVEASSGGGLMANNGGEPFLPILTTYWDGFELPNLPEGATIEAIYPVLMASGNPLPLGCYYAWSALSGSGSAGPTNFPSTAFSEQLYLTSIGASIEDVEDAAITLTLEASLEGTGQRTVSIGFVALAVYYTTANPPNPPISYPPVTRWETIPSDLQLVAIPVGWPAGADLEIDRIEIFDWDQPVLQNQVMASYGVQPEAFDGVTGKVDISDYTTDPITDIFRFLNQLYICTQSRWFATQDNGTTEPDGWTLQEVSNAVGALGPMADDVGEEFVLIADLRGLWIFDGGSHVKLSQEAQDLWDSLDFSLAAGFWLRNDRHRQRVLFGCALPTPGKYTVLPAASPARNNAILLCSYLTLAPGSMIAMGPGVTVSQFTGQLIFREGGRKWGVWSIPAWYADWIPQPDGGEQLWLGSAAESKIYYMDETNPTDDGAAIPEAYGTSNFSDPQAEQNLQIGSARKLYGPVSATVDVVGKFVLTILPESTSNPYALTLPPLGGHSPALGDTFLPVSVPANRVFLLWRTDGAVGSSFALRKIVMGAQPHPRIPVTGRLG